MAHALFHLLLALAAVVVLGRLLGSLFGMLRQPPVIGEVLAGIALGPSLLGRIAPDAYSYLLPSSTAPHLNAVAQVGVALYMFLVGLELNLDRLRTRARMTVAISNAGIIVPFVLGVILAFYLHPRLSTAAVPFRSFALFIGVAMSITAFPVLARILADRRIAESELGIVALTCAAVDDVTAWCLLALVVGVARARVHSALSAAFLTLGFIAIVLLAVRPVVARLASRARATPTTIALTITLACAVLSALTTEWIGVRAIFGAFLFGAIVPHDSGLARTLTGAPKTLVTVFLLPAFFAFAGMRTRIDLMSTASDWLTCALIILVATVGKFGGCCAAARAMGMRLRQAAGLGILMNTRGLMELIVLNIGLDLGVISPTLFTMMVLMALATTMATTPLLDLLAVRLGRDGCPRSGQP